MLKRVLAVPVTAETVEPAIYVGTAETPGAAIRLLAASGFTVIPADDGGNLDEYDASDAPHVYGFEPDGSGAFGVSVAA